MVLAFNIGISTITLGGFENNNLRFVVSMAANTNETADQYAAAILSLLSLKGIKTDRVDGVAIASVLPSLNRVIRSAVKILWNVEPLTVGPGVKTGLGIRCDLPSSVGADIICACVACNTLYGHPGLIIDIDSVTKFTVVDYTGAFVGTSIAPGISMGLSALSENAALLPNVELSPPSELIAKNTADCMRSGIIYGGASMVDGMIDRFFGELGGEIPVVVTGSDSGIILPYCKHKMILDEHLVLKGLNLIYQKNN